MSRRRAILLAAIACSTAFGASRNETALDRYVHTPDSSYKYELVRTMPGQGYTTYVLDMTSQTWRTPAEIDRTQWKHWVTIVKPDTVKHSTGFLFITGGSNNNPRPPDNPDSWLRDMAVLTGSVVSEVRMIPNQPLTMAGETKGRTEDSFIAYTWDKFLRTGDELWPARLPMTKAAVRALDSITSFCASPERGSVKVDKFVVSGGSKRGWTTWTTAAVDSRVVAIAPIVIDMLNLENSFDHHWRVYGFWAPAVQDYTNFRIMDWTGTPQYRALMKIEEPYEYRGRLTIPKYIVNSAGDQFFLPDSSQFYFDDLKGEKQLRYVPNTDHSLRNSDARESVTAFYDAFLNGVKRPRLTWKFEKNGNIRVKSTDQPSEVKLWQATNPEKRDFRLVSIGQAYKSSAVTAKGGGIYEAGVEKPQSGWTAFFLEMTYPTAGKHPIKITTGIRVWPDTLPFPAPPRNGPPPPIGGGN
jgi:PhoPQ-activated pathogenicity-related protein